MMDEKIIRSMKKDERDLAACTEKLEQTRQLLRAGREEEAGEILRAIATLGNEITVRHRQMVMDTGDPNARADVERIIAEIHPVEIGFTPEGWFGSGWSRWPEPEIPLPRNTSVGSSILPCGGSSQTRQRSGIPGVP